MSTDTFIPVQGCGGYEVVTEFLKNRVDKLILIAAKMDPETPTTGLTEDQATQLAAQLTQWVEENRPLRGRRRSR